MTVYDHTCSVTAGGPEELPRDVPRKLELDVLDALRRAAALVDDLPHTLRHLRHAAAQRARRAGEERVRR